MSDSSSSVTSTTRFPIRYIDHSQGRLWNKTIYDVEGNPVLGPNGSPISFFHTELKTLFLNNSVHIYHRLAEPAYRYIVTSTWQLNKFLEDRFSGSTELKVYHVYVDEDADKNSQEYRQFFTPYRPQLHRNKTY